MPQLSKPCTLVRPDGETIAYHATAGNGAGAATVVFLGGFMSDMGGTKAIALQEWADQAGRGFVRFDYYGHGQSSGDFPKGTISRWAEDAIAVIDAVTTGPLVLVGSSMGGWVGLKAALARPDRVHAFVGIAPAPDFTEKLMWAGFPDHIREKIMTEGAFAKPSDYDDEPYIISKALIEDGRENQLLDAPIALNCPVRILQGMQDPDVPWKHAFKLIDAIDSDDLEFTLIKSGDHRLSAPADTARLIRTIEALL